MFNPHKAKTRLSRPADRAIAGEEIVIGKSGKRIPAVDAPPEPKRLGFLAAQISVPRDFDRIGAKELADLFEGGA